MYSRTSFLPDSQISIMLTTIFGRKHLFAIIALPLLLIGCGGGGGDDDNDEPIDSVGSVGPGVDQPASGDDPVPSFMFQMDQEFVNLSSPEFVAFVESQLGGSVAPFNSVDNLFLNTQLPVIYGSCGVANAFYSPQERLIVICDELGKVAYDLYRSTQDGDSDDEIGTATLFAFDTLTFILYHEIGHALYDIRDFSVGGNFESVADAIGVVLSVQTGQPLAVIASAAFVSEIDESSSFADEHGSGVDRSGDMFCWVIGSSLQVAGVLPELTAAFVDAGRDCVAEYANQYEFVSQLVPDLEDIPLRASLKMEMSKAEQDLLARLDKLNAKRLRAGAEETLPSGS